MSADDTSREALVERVGRVLDDEFPLYPGAIADATAVVDAVVMPLVEERDEANRWRTEAAQVGAYGAVCAELAATRVRHAEYGQAAVRRIREAETDRDTWHQRWQQLMRDHEEAVRHRDEFQAEVERLRENADLMAEAHQRMKRAVDIWLARCEERTAERNTARADHQALTDAVRGVLDRPVHPYGEKDRPTIPEGEFLADAYGPEIVADLRGILDEHGAP